jgi:hypothetical protein
MGIHLQAPKCRSLSLFALTQVGRCIRSQRIQVADPSDALQGERAIRETLTRNRLNFQPISTAALTSEKHNSMPGFDPRIERTTLYRKDNLKSA